MDSNRANDMMLTLGFNDTMHQLAMTNIVYYYGHVLRRGR